MTTMTRGHVAESRAIFIPHSTHQATRPEGKTLTPLIVVAALALCVSIGIAVVGATWLPLAAVAATIAFVCLVAVGEYWGLLVWFALSPWLQPFAADYLGIGTPVSFDRIFFPAVFAAFLIRRVTSRRPLTIDWATGLMAVFVTYYGITLLYANDPYKDGVELVQHYILSFATYIVVAATVTTTSRLGILLGVGLVNTIGLSAIGILEHFTGTSIFTGSLAFGGIYQGRAAGPFVNPAVYGPVLCMLAFLTIIYARTSQRRGRIILGLVALGLTGVACFFTYTRSVWLSLLIGLITFAAFDRRLRLPVFAGLVALAIGIWILLPNLEADPDLYNRLADPANAIGRVDNAALQWQAFARSPLFGSGPGVFSAWNNIREGWVSHNAFLTILVDNGLLGLLLFVATLVAAVARTIKAFLACEPDSLQRGTVVACWAGIATYLTTTMFIDDIYFVFPTAFYWMALALPIAVRRSGGTT